MKILCVCDQGNSRSPTIASVLRYSGHETLAVGADTAKYATLLMLADWCDKAIFTHPDQQAAFPTVGPDRAIVWDIPDAFPRPFNPELLRLVRHLIQKEGLNG